MLAGAYEVEDQLAHLAPGTIVPVKVDDDSLFMRFAIAVGRGFFALVWISVVAGVLLVPVGLLIAAISFLSKWVSVCVR